MATTAAAFASVSANPGFTFCARCTSSATDGLCISAATDVVPAAGRSSGGSANSDSAPILSGARLVATTVSPGQYETSVAMSPAASRTCSRLSSTRSMRRSPITVHSASIAARPCASATSSVVAIADATSAAFETEASETNAASSVKCVASRSCSSMAKRVFPVPPDPVTVSTRAPETIRSTAESRRASRPRSGVDGAGGGLRMAVRRATVVAGIAAAVASGSRRLMASRHSCMLAKRSAGTFASARTIALLNAPETPGRTVSIEGTASSAWRAMIAIALGPTNGGAPTSISYATQARAYKSLRASMMSPLACSGLM